MPEHKKTAGQRFYIFCENISNKTQRVRNKNTLMLAMCLRTFTDNYRSPRLSFDPTLGSRNTQKSTCQETIISCIFPFNHVGGPVPRGS